MKTNTQRLDKYLSRLGICSRRNVGKLLKEKNVMVNGTPATEPGLRIDPGKDAINLDGKRIKTPRLAYYLLNQPQLRSLRNGVRLHDGKTAPAEVRIVKEGYSFSYLEITLHEGKNRQIRRMCEAVRINLLELSRIQFGPISIGTIKEGAYRELTDAEVDDLRQTAAVSL